MINDCLEYTVRPVKANPVTLYFDLIINYLVRLQQ